MNKIYAFLLAGVLTAAVTGCGNGKGGNVENQADDQAAAVVEENAAEAPDAMAETSWVYMEGDEMMMGLYVEYGITFRGGHFCFYQVSDHRTDPAQYLRGYGKYTYDEGNGSGSAQLQNEDNDQPLGTLTYSVSGDVLTLTFDGETYTMKKRAF